MSRPNGGAEEKGKTEWILFGLLTLLAAVGCQPASSANAPTAPKGVGRTFNDADWAAVLSAVVTPDGYVTWDLVQSDAGVRRSLLRYVGLIGAVSPANHPELFATANDRLAYWINAINATCLYAVIEHNYPGTMLAGTPPGAIFSLEEFTFGGRRMTLHEAIGREVQPAGDPRVFFALNFCAASSPPLRTRPYDGAMLDGQLMDQGQRYLSDRRAAVREGEAVRLNDLLLVLHEADFLAGFQKMFGRKPTGILEALQPYVQSDSPIVGATKVEPLGFDWSLNRPPR
ncbi:MAG: DUF547 domain-containing protein [Tepidisphaeraceae bacterium]|jgi:hypothetical protein